MTTPQANCTRCWSRSNNNPRSTTTSESLLVEVLADKTSLMWLVHPTRTQAEVARTAEVVARQWSTDCPLFHSQARHPVEFSGVVGDDHAVLGHGVSCN